MNDNLVEIQKILSNTYGLANEMEVKGQKNVAYLYGIMTNLKLISEKLDKMMEEKPEA